MLQPVQPCFTKHSVPVRRVQPCSGWCHLHYHVPATHSLTGRASQSLAARLYGCHPLSELTIHRSASCRRHSDNVMHGLAPSQHLAVSPATSETIFSGTGLRPRFMQYVVHRQESSRRAQRGARAFMVINEPSSRCHLISMSLTEQ
jgi:hypothetical protein